MREKGFTLVELLAVIVILALVSVIVTPIVFNIIDKVKGNARTATANRVLSSAKLFYEMSLLDLDISYPTDGLEFICDKKVCEATIGTVKIEDGIAILSEEKPIVYQLSFTGTVPSSGSIVLYNDGNIVPKNLAVDSHLCTYDEELKVFTHC